VGEFRHVTSEFREENVSMLFSVRALKAMQNSYVCLPDTATILLKSFRSCVPRYGTGLSDSTY